MIDEPKIWTSAQEIIDRYGDDALRQINARIDELQSHGEAEAHSVWLRIREAAEVLLKNRDAGLKH